MGALANPRFRRLLIGRSVSSFGDSALYLSLGIWAKDLTGSNAAAGEVFLAMGLAYLTAPYAGRLADRLRRRPLLIATNAVTAAIVLSLLAVQGRGQLWIIDAVAVGYGISGVVSGAASAGLFRDLLPDEDLGAANAAIQTASQGLRLVSPAVGAGLYAAFGGGSLAILDAATFVVVIIALASIDVPEEAAVTRRGDQTRSGLLDGFGHLSHTPLLAQLTGATAAAMLVLGFYESVTFAVIAAIHRPASFFGVLMSVQAAGSIAGGLLATRLMNRFGEARTLGLALAAWVLATAIYTIPVLPASLIALFIFGAAVPLSAVAVATANQRFTPPHLQGRVSSASNMITTLTQTASIAVGAALVDTIGYEPLLATAAVVMAGPALILLLHAKPPPPSTIAAKPAQTLCDKS